MKRFKYICALFILAVLAGCQSLEDTYSEYTEGGKNRYLGQCDNLTLTAGWQRIIVEWTNPIDPAVTGTKIAWSSTSTSGEMELKGDVTSYIITGINVNENIKVEVMGQDSEGSVSVAKSAYIKPFTEEHEEVVSFARVVSRHYFVNDRLVLLFNNWNSGITHSELRYTTPSGVSKVFELTEDIVSDDFMLLEDMVDETKPVTLHTSGKLTSLEEEVQFTPYSLSTDKTFSPEYRTLFRTVYGKDDISDADIQAMESLEMNFDMTSFENLLLLNNLKTLYLGNNRYMSNDLTEEAKETYASVLDEHSISKFALDVLKEINGLEVKRYNAHYIPSDWALPYLTEMGNPTLPSVDYHSTTDWTIQTNDEDKGVESRVANLINGSIVDYWRSTISGIARSHTITIDMKEAKTIKGVDITQIFFLDSDIDEPSLMPRDLKISVSDDNAKWENFSNSESVKLGGSSNEVTRIMAATDINARYIRFIINDNVVDNAFRVSLAEIGLF